MVNRRRLFLTSIAGLVLSLALSGCAGPLVKTDLQTFQQHPEQFEGKQVILTTTVEQVREHPDDYVGRKVELTGLVVYKGFRGAPYWNFILRDERERFLTCYEREYRLEAWVMPDEAVKRATRENEPVTVVGKIEKDLSVELNWIEYRGQHYNTNHKPVHIPIPFY